MFKKIEKSVRVLVEQKIEKVFVFLFFFSALFLVYWTMHNSLVGL